MPRANKALLGILVFALSAFAGRLLVESWAVPIFTGALLAAAAATLLVLVAAIIKGAGRDELERARLARLRTFQRQPEPLQRINAAKRCSGCWGPLTRPYVRDGKGFRSLQCCERRRDTEQRRRVFFDPSEIRAARRAGLIGG